MSIFAKLFCKLWFKRCTKPPPVCKAIMLSPFAKPFGYGDIANVEKNLFALKILLTPMGYISLHLSWLICGQKPRTIRVTDKIPNKSNPFHTPQWSRSLLGKLFIEGLKEELKQRKFIMFSCLKTS